MAGITAWLLAGAGRETTRRSLRWHRDCVKAIPRRQPRIGYVGAAAGDDPDAEAFLRTLAFETAAVVSIRLARRGTTTTAIRNDLAAADLIFFAPGDVARAMDLIDARGLAPYLRVLAAQGKPMEGVSAGAILLGRHAVISAGRRRVLRDCLGLVPCSFEVHGEHDGWRDLRALARLLTAARAPAAPALPAAVGIASDRAAVWRDDTLTPLGGPLIPVPRPAPDAERGRRRDTL